MSSDVFIISCARKAEPGAAIRRALEEAGVTPSRVEDAVFGAGEVSALPDIGAIAQAAGLNCPCVGISSPLRALSFCAASILSEEAVLSVVVGIESGECSAFVLAAPDRVSILNLLPCARIAARSLAGPEPALRLAGLNPGDVQIEKRGDSLVTLQTLLEELEAQSFRCGLISNRGVAILIERI
ncbi:MAG TPA: hypothetical protein VMJ64_02865 [Anaerolineales bacterium]|nr:hypothetical protein [Anaerolineales bacterium]